MNANRVKQLKYLFNISPQPLFCFCVVSSLGSQQKLDLTFFHETHKSRWRQRRSVKTWINYDEKCNCECLSVFVLPCTWVPNGKRNKKSCCEHVKSFPFNEWLWNIFLWTGFEIWLAVCVRLRLRCEARVINEISSGITRSLLFFSFHFHQLNASRRECGMTES